MSELAPKLKLAKRRVLADEVVDGLRDAILSHEFPPGSRLGEDDLAIQMGVSRGPVREALISLEREGLVTIERHRGARVASWSKKDAAEIYTMRGALEELAIEWACKNATKQDIADMKEILAIYKNLPETQQTRSKVSSLDLEFHSLLFHSAHHERLSFAWEGLRSQIHAMLFYAIDKNQKVNKADWPKWLVSHQALVDSIESGKVTVARKEIQLHVTGGFEKVAKSLAE
ncbi:MAG: GntR family transcriptional regulator [Actinomycetes bacterium]